MCLILEIRGDALTAPEAMRIAALSEVLWAGPDAPPYVTVGHGCDMLAEDADWDAASWEMSTEGRDILRDALRLVFGEIAGPLTFTAMWWEGADAPPVPMQAVTREELVALVDANAIGTQSGYDVRA